METYTTKYETDSQWESAVCLRKLKEGLSINPEGWDGAGDGGGLKGRGYIYIHIHIYIYIYLFLFIKVKIF